MFSLRWVPHALTSTHEPQCVDDSRIFLKALKADAKNGFVNLITTDESWYYWYYEHTLQWTTLRDLVPPRTLKKIDSKESMFTLVFSGNLLLALTILPKD
jgi:hypothetical protein